MTYDLGFLGGGQLARMSIQAAQRMGLRCVALDPASKPPASFVADHIRGDLDDPESIARILERANRVTLENEFIPATSVSRAFDLTGMDTAKLIPGLQSLALIQDKLLQRSVLLEAGVPSPRAVGIQNDGREAIEQIGFPMVLKLRFGGYDGKGTRYARNLEEWEALRPQWSQGGWLAEQFVPFERELAVMVAVGNEGPLAFPTVETVQEKSVCDLVFPSTADGSAIGIAAVQAIKGKGLYGVELFQLESGELLVNEMAPRPHNTGHYTLDWGGPSQFEYHVRSVMGFHMERPRSNGFAVMANLLGQPEARDPLNGTAAALETPNCFVHWYQKLESKPGRKMGHLNVAGSDLAKLPEVLSSAREARRRFYEAWTG